MKQKILLVEDNDPLRENTSELLELHNYEVYTACNGREGIELALEVQPDLILCDILMPEMDGFGLLKHIRTHPILSHTYFVFFSANAQQKEVRQGLDLGANDYLVKPFTETVLLACLEKYNRSSAVNILRPITQVPS